MLVSYHVTIAALHGNALEQPFRDMCSSDGLALRVLCVVPLFNDWRHHCVIGAAVDDETRVHAGIQTDSHRLGNETHPENTRQLSRIFYQKVYKYVRNYCFQASGKELNTRPLTYPGIFNSSKA